MWWKPFLLSFAFVGSCTSGDGDGISFFDEDPDGLWTGTLTRDGAATTVRGFVRAGDLLVFGPSGDVVLRASITVEGDDLSGTATLFEANGADVASAVETVSLDGTVNEQASITASFTDAGGDDGTLSLVYNSNFETGSSLEFTAGIWSRTIGTETLTLTISNAGALNGSDTDGCNYSGDVSLLDADFNLYGVTVIITNCLAKAGTYTGFGALEDTAAEDDTFLVAFSNNIRADGETLTRQ